MSETGLGTQGRLRTQARHGSETHRSPVTAVVLAGGRSSRFGSDKLAAELDGRPLLHHALAAVSAVADEIVLVAAPEGEPGLPADPPVPIRVVRDPEPFGGPLVGALAGARAARGQRLLVVAGDMPGLAPAVLRALLDAPGAAHLAAPDPGRLQPLPFAAGTDAVRIAAPARLAEGDRSLRGLLAALGAAAIPVAEWGPLDPARTTLRDVDTPDDLASARD